MIGIKIGSDLSLCTIAVGQELLLVVKQLFPSFCRELRVVGLDNGVDRASLLAETAVNALGHVDIIFCRPPRSIFTSLRLNGDGLSGADGFAEFARNAALFTGSVPSQSVFSTETRAERALFEWVHDGIRRTEELLQYDPHASDNFSEEEKLHSLVNGGWLASIRIH